MDGHDIIGNPASETGLVATFAHLSDVIARARNA